MPEPVTITARDGWLLKGDLHEPSGPARGTVLAGHAMMANRRSLDRPPGEGLVATLVRGGLRVVTVDVRGHGESGPLPPEGGAYSYDDIVEKDIPAAVEFVRTRFSGRAALLGHSLVGHAALAWLSGPEAAGSGGIAAIAAYAPNAWLKSCEPDEKRWQAKIAQLRMWEQMSQAKGYFPARQMKIGSDDVSGPYIRQFVQWASEDRWVSLAGRDYRAGLATIRIPLLVAVGAGDRMLCVPECCERFISPVPRERLTWWLVSEAGGFGLDADHMPLVTDARARPLWERTADWLRDRLG